MSEQQRQKLVFIGDAGVGKTSLVDRINNHEFDEKRYPTLAFDTSVFQHKNTIYTVWDTGSGKFKGLGDVYWYDADRVVIVVDGTTTMDRLNFYKQRLAQICGEIPVIIAVNKCDLEGTVEKFQHLKQDDNVVFISCKDGVGIQQFLNKL